MVLSQSLVSGSREEWALTKRHRSEKCFGVQLCGGKPTMMVPAAEALRTVMTRDASRGIDFVDINLVGAVEAVGGFLLMTGIGMSYRFDLSTWCRIST